MFTPADLPAPRYRLDSDAILGAMAGIGLAKPTADDLRAGAALAENLMNHKVVSVETLLAVQAAQPASSLVFKEDGVVTGTTGQLMLRANAIPAFFEDRFSSTVVNLDFLARDGEWIAVGYGWGLAAATPAAREAVMASAQLFRCDLFPHLATFARAVSAVGRHISIAHYHYKPFRHPEDDMLLRLPCVEAQAATDAARAARALVRKVVAA
jgi:hypothetical protein